MKSNVESQIAAKKSDLTKNHGEMSDSAFTKERSEFHKWKAGALRFRNGVDERLRQAKDARSSLFGSVYPDMIREERNSVIAENVRLKDAIRRHQEIVTNEYDPTEADEELWSVVGSNS